MISTAFRRPVHLYKPFNLCPFPYLTFSFFFFHLSAFGKSITLSICHSHLALGDFDFSQSQLHKIISTITTTESEEGHSSGEKGFSRLSEASVGLQQPVKCCPFLPNTDKSTANWKIQDWTAHSTQLATQLCSRKVAKKNLAVTLQIAQIVQIWQQTLWGVLSSLTGYFWHVAHAEHSWHTCFVFTKNSSNVFAMITCWAIWWSPAFVLSWLQLHLYYDHNYLRGSDTHCNQLHLRGSHFLTLL